MGTDSQFRGYCKLDYKLVKKIWGDVIKYKKQKKKLKNKDNLRKSDGLIVLYIARKK